MHTGVRVGSQRTDLTKKGLSMPKLTTKISVKLEPDQLYDLQEVAESQGLTVSRCVRKAVVSYIREHNEEGGSSVLRLTLTRLEKEAVGSLVDLGVIDDPEEFFHKAFTDYMAEGVKKPLETLDRIKQLRPVPNRRSGTPVPIDIEVDGDERGEGEEDSNR